jgi:hypothetical protein
MMKPIAIAVLVLGLSANAHADVWKWVDQVGEEHFVTSDRPIYTWLDGSEVYFSDKPEHPDARPVELVWHSPGTLADVEEAKAAEDPNAVPGETPEQAAARRAAEAYYCSQATEILNTYNNAPQLYRTGENGERYYLTVAEEAEAVAEAQAGIDEFCH